MKPRKTIKEIRPAIERIDKELKQLVATVEANKSKKLRRELACILEGYAEILNMRMEQDQKLQELKQERKQTLAALKENWLDNPE